MNVSPISSVNFRGTTGVNMLEREGAFAKKPETDAMTTTAPKKSTGKKVMKWVLGLATVAAAVVALPKLFPNAIKVLENLEGAKFGQKIGHYIAKAGDAIWSPIAKIFSKGA